MSQNEDELRLRIIETGADQVSGKLKQLTAAQTKVIDATKAQTAANRAETSSLLELERQITKGKKLWEEFGSAKTKASQAGAGGANTDRIVGAAGRAAGAISPGLGSTVRDIQDIQEFGKSLGDISKVAVGAGVGIGAATFALAKLQEQAQRVKEAAAIELNARAEVIGFIQTATKAEIDARIEELRQRQAINKAIADDANSVYQQLDSQTNVIGKLNAALGTNQGELAAAKAAADKANAALGETNTALNLLEQAAAANFAPTERLAEKEKELADIRAKATEQGIQYIVNEKKFQQEAIQLSTQQIKQRQLDIANEKERINLEITARQAAGDTSGKLDELVIRLAELGNQETFLAGTATDLAKAREAEAQAMDYQQQQLKETAAAVKQYNSDIEALNQKDLESREKLRDALIEIVDQAQKAAEAALDKLLQTRAELQRDLSRDEDKAARDAAVERINIQIDSYSQEIDAYKAYKRRLRDIDLKAQDDAFNLALNRDFAGLFESNRQVDIAKRDAAQAVRDQIEDAREARLRQLEDLQRSLEVERQERLIAFQQRLADAQAAYVQEQAQIEVQRREAEAKAQAARIKEKAAIDQQYATRLQAAQNELNLISQTEQQRINIMASAQNALIAQAQQLLAAVSSFGGGGGGGGGFLPSAGSQAFGGGGRGGGSFQFNLSQSFSGGFNEQRLAELSKDQTVKVVKQLLGVT